MRPGTSWLAHGARPPARWWGEPLRLRTLVLAALGGALLLPAGARADMVGTSVAACVPAKDLPTGPNDTTWSVRACGMADYDQRRSGIVDVGQPTAISVQALPGQG